MELVWIAGASGPFGIVSVHFPVSTLVCYLELLILWVIVFRYPGHVIWSERVGRPL